MPKYGDCYGERVIRRGVCGKNGAPVEWHISDNTLFITGNGMMSDYGMPSDNTDGIPAPPWNDEDDLIYNIEVEEGVENIGSCAFACLTAVLGVNLPDSVHFIGKRAFMYNSLRRIHLGKGLTTICEEAFSDCYHLKEAHIPEHVAVIEDRAFFYCRELERVKLPRHMAAIGSYVFAQCYLLGKVKLPETLFILGDYAFVNCGLSPKSKIPAHLRVIGEWAFGGGLGFADTGRQGPLPGVVTGLEAAGLKPLPESEPSNSFHLLKNSGDCGECKGSVFWKLSDDGTLKIYGEGEMKNYLTLADGYQDLAPWNWAGERIVRLVIESGVTTVGDGAFYSLENLTEVEIAPTVRDIGWRAFKNCRRLEEITVPGSVERIGCEAFTGCDELSQVNLESGLRIIGGRAFRFCYSLECIVFPDTLECIEGHAFTDSGIRKVRFLGHAPDMGYCPFLTPESKLAIYPADDPTWDSMEIPTGMGLYEWESDVVHFKLK